MTTTDQSHRQQAQRRLVALAEAEHLQSARKSINILIFVLSVLFAACMLLIAGRAALGPDAIDAIWVLPSNTVLALIALATAALAMVAVVLSVGVLKPIERLSRAAQQIAVGDRAVMVAIEHEYAEAQWLSIALNSLAEEIDSLRNQMDILVREQTAHLNMTQDALQNEIEQRQKVEQEQKRLLNQLSDLAHTDPLTGAFNRRAFFDLLDRHWTLARRGNRPLGVAMLDIDNFKRINDTYGHQVGDVVLCEVARRCASVLRHEDVMGRYGGEEFAFVLPDAHSHGLTIAAERMRTAIAELPVETTAGPLYVTASIGVASTHTGSLLGVPVRRLNTSGQPISSLSPQEFIRMADEAQYEAKQAGKDRVVLARDYVLTAELGVYIDDKRRNAKL